jgi:hypothetical protein
MLNKKKLTHKQFTWAFYIPILHYGHMTETIKVEVDDALAKRFRQRAMEKYSYKRGAVKKALEEIMSNFISESSSSRPTKRKVDWSFLEGAGKDRYKGMTSVEIQHSIWQAGNEST